jgi:hypothetical protein
LINNPQIYGANYPTAFPNGKKSGNGFLWVLIFAVPFVLILSGIIFVGVFYLAALKKKNVEPYSPRTSSSPQKPQNLLLAFGKDGLGQGEFRKAESVAVDKAGNFYVGDGTLRIQKFDPQGKFLQLWNVTESTIKPDEQYNKAVSHLAVDSQNRLWAAVQSEELLRYDAATGKFIDKIKLTGDKFAGTPQSIRILDMVMLNDDHLAIFATSFPEGEYILTVSPEGKPEVKFKDLLKKQDKNAANLINGYLLINVTGDIFLMGGIPFANKTYVYHFKPDGSYTDRFTWDGAPNMSVLYNKIIALNAKGEIYAYGGGGKPQISVLSTEGVLLRTIPVGTNYYYRRMILDADDNIIVLSNNKVEKYAPTGN